MARILGIDPGSRVTGYGIIDGDWGSGRCVAYGTIRLGQDRPMGPRLADLFKALGEVIAQYAVEHMAVERVFVAKNADSALKLGHARGVVLLAAEIAHLPVFEYTPAQVKKSVTGSGRAEKAQIVSLVRAILNLKEDPPEDAADALAIAMTHQMQAGTQAAIMEALGDQRGGRR